MNYVLSPKKIGKKIKSLRQASGMTQQVIAGKLRVSRQFLVYLEQGQRGLTLHRLNLLATVFDVEPNDIIGANGNGKRKTA